MTFYENEREGRSGRECLDAREVRGKRYEEMEGEGREEKGRAWEG